MRFAATSRRLRPSSLHAKRARAAQLTLCCRLCSAADVEHSGVCRRCASRCRVAASRLIPVLGACEVCGAPATDRHHRDGHPENNVRSNLAQLCRSCHMTADGRLERLRVMGQRDKMQPAKPCVTCWRPAKPLRRGRCPRCRQASRRLGAKLQRLAQRNNVIVTGWMHGDLRGGRGGQGTGLPSCAPVGLPRRAMPPGRNALREKVLPTKIACG
jgi:hypothetical protein